MHDRFLADVLANPHNRTVLARWNDLGLPDAWLVAGCLFQTVWNLKCGRAPTEGILDHDLFYFDEAHCTEADERRVQARVDALFAGTGIVVEASNQARVHLWYEDHFGHPYAPLRGVREGIARFLVPQTCVGIRPHAEVYAPYGLQGLYDGELTMNPLVPHRDLFERKVASYRARWPWLRVNA